MVASKADLAKSIAYQPFNLMKVQVGRRVVATRAAQFNFWKVLDQALFNFGDNLTVTPFGQSYGVARDQIYSKWWIIIVRGVTPQGQALHFARLHLQTEFSWRCFFTRMVQLCFVDIFTTCKDYCISGAMG